MPRCSSANGPFLPRPHQPSVVADPPCYFSVGPAVLGVENSEVLPPGLVAVAVTFCPAPRGWARMRPKETLPFLSVIAVV